MNTDSQTDIQTNAHTDIPSLSLVLRGDEVELTLYTLHTSRILKDKLTWMKFILKKVLLSDWKILLTNNTELKLKWCELPLVRFVSMSFSKAHASS